MTVEILVTADKPDPARAPDRDARDDAALATPGMSPAAASREDSTRQGPLSALERAAFFAALRRKADARLSALG
jgi:hypothetical protein